MARNFVDAVKEMHLKMNTINSTSTPGVSSAVVDQKIKQGQVELINALRTKPNLLKKQTGKVTK